MCIPSIYRSLSMHKCVVGTWNLAVPPCCRPRDPCSGVEFDLTIFYTFRPVALVEANQHDKHIASSVLTGLQHWQLPHSFLTVFIQFLSKFILLLGPQFHKFLKLYCWNREGITLFLLILSGLLPLLGWTLKGNKALTVSGSCWRQTFISG